MGFLVGVIHDSRGNPTVKAVKELAPKRKRRKMTAAQKKAVGIRMAKYWAERRKAKAAKS